MTLSCVILLSALLLAINSFLLRASGEVWRSFSGVLRADETKDLEHELDQKFRSSLMSLLMLLLTQINTHVPKIHSTKVLSHV